MSPSSSSTPTKDCVLVIYECEWLSYYNKSSINLIILFENSWGFIFWRTFRIFSICAFSSYNQLSFNQSFTSIHVLLVQFHYHQCNTYKNYSTNTQYTFNSPYYSSPAQLFSAEGSSLPHPLLLLGQICLSLLKYCTCTRWHSHSVQSNVCVSLTWLSRRRRRLPFHSTPGGHGTKCPGPWPSS